MVVNSDTEQNCLLLYGSTHYMNLGIRKWSGAFWMELTLSV
jgi:hypothetical protein